MHLRAVLVSLFALGAVSCSGDDDGQEDVEPEPTPPPDVPEEPPVDPPPTTSDLIISEVRTTSISEAGGFRNTFVEVYNGTQTEVDLSSYGLWYSSNGSGGRWDEETQLTLSGSLPHGDVIIIVREGTDSILFPFPDYVWPELRANGDDGVALVKDSGDGFEVIDQYGEPYASDDAPSFGAWDIAGIEDGSKDYVLWRKWLVSDPNTDWIQAAGTTEIGSEWIVRSKDDYTNIGTYTPDIADFEPEEPSNPPPVTSDLMLSEVRVTSTAEGDFRNTYVEIYNGTEATVDLTGYALQYASNGNSGEYNPDTQLDLSGTLEHGDVIVVARSGTDPDLVPDPDYEWSNLTANGDDAVGLFRLDGDEPTLIDQYGEPFDSDNDPDGAWDVAGVEEASKDTVLWRKWTVSGPNADWPASAGTNETNSEWIVREKADYSNLGTYTPKDNG